MGNGGLNTTHMGGKVSEWWEVRQQQNKYLFGIIVLGASIVIGFFYYLYLLQRVDVLLNKFTVLDLVKTSFYLIIGTVIFSPIVRSVCLKLQFIPFDINYHVSNEEWNKIRLKRLCVYMLIGAIIFLLSYVFLKMF